MTPPHLSGFADEAADGIAGQIAATRALGWAWIEARNVDGVNLHDGDDAAFERVVAALQEGGVGIHCFGSAIANWATHIDQPADATLAQVRRAIPRMRRLGTALVRIMSFAIRRDPATRRALDDQLVVARIARLRTIVGMFRDAGITPVHENCNNWGGMAASYTLRLLEAVPGLALVFDTGNPIHSDDVDAAPRADGTRPKQSSWAFYRQVRERVVHVHIKDAKRDPVTGAAPHCWPGEGDGDVRAIVKDLLGRGYPGAFSIEPHLAIDRAAPTAAADRHAAYVEYGRRLERLIAEVRAELDAERSRAAATG